MAQAEEDRAVLNPEEEEEEEEEDLEDETDDEANTIDEELNDRFSTATSYVSSIVMSLNSSQLLRFYAFFKQARFGPCNTPRPSWYALEAKQKWDAWSKLKDMPKEEAMKAYIAYLEEFDADWENKCERSGASGQNWVAVSTMANGEALIDDADKTIYDWVKEGNLERFKQAVRGKNVNAKDADGLGLIHWAADRGNLEIITYLVVDLRANIDLRDEDGQTAVHYAASCGHREVLQFLIDNGAKRSIEDNEGIKPKDIAADREIRQILGV